MKKHDIQISSKTNIPSLFELKELSKKTKTNTQKLKILHVFDLVIIDKDGLKYTFEVCHKHPCDDAKIEWLKQNNVCGYEFDAEWIMNLVQAPFTLNIKRTLHKRA